MNSATGATSGHFAASTTPSSVPEVLGLRSQAFLYEGVMLVGNVREE